MNLTKPVFLVWSCLAFFVMAAQEPYSKVKIDVSSAEARDRLIRQLELDHFSMEGNSIVCEIPSRYIQKLSLSGYRHKVLIADVAGQLAEENRRYDQQQQRQSPELRMGYDQPCKSVSSIIRQPTAFHTDGDMGGYYNYDEMATAMDDLVAAYPTLVSKTSLGKSFENRDIWCVKISDNVTTDESGEPEVFYSGLQHAREAITGTSLIFFMQYLAENYASDTRIQSLVNNREIFIVPCVNPDGYEQNRSTNPGGGGMWRKNKTGVDGTDLNRNYSVDWGVSGGGSSSPTDDTYWGTAAFSEPETQAIRNFVTARNFVIAIDQHCHGSYYSLPFGFPSLHTLSSTDQSFYSYIPALMGKYNCHRAGNSPETVGYNVAGGIKDWLLLGDIGTGTKGKIYGMTGEAGGGSFWAPKASIISLCQGLCYQNLQLAYAAGTYSDLQDVSSDDVTSSSGNFSFLLRRVGLGNQPVTVSLLPLENIQTAGTPVTVSSLANYYDTYNGSISYSLSPSILNGQRIKFAWKIESDGIVLYDTITKFYNPVMLLEDDMEGTVGTKWTLPSGGNANSKWNFSSTSAYAGSKSLTETPAGNYSSNENRIITSSSSFDLSNATAAYLSFWTRHRAENCKDKLQVQISTNGSTYTPICGKMTISENDGTLAGQPAITGIRESWAKEVFDLENYLGNSSVTLRFQFLSDNDGGSFAYERDEGVYIDNLKLFKSTTTINLLPVRFLNVQGKLLTDQTVRISWEAYTDSEHGYFEVERSADGQHFISLGRAGTSAPYMHMDKFPNPGINYYRIRQWDKTGQSSLSPIVTIRVDRGYSVSVFPNPVHDQLEVRLDSRTTETIMIQLCDLNGKIIEEQKRQVMANSNVVGMRIGHHPPQVYILRILNTRGETLHHQKIIKL